MTCLGCVRHVREALQSVPGVAQATVDLDTQTARVRWQQGVRTDTEAVMRAVTAAGYEPETIEARTTTLHVPGMDCQNCVRHVREALEVVPGIARVTLDLEAKSATLGWQKGISANPEAAVRAVANAGYAAQLAEPARSAVAAEAPRSWSGWGVNLAIGVPVTVLLMLGEWVFHLAMVPWFRWVAFALATVVQIVAGARFYRGAWLQLKARSSNMDTLVALGSTTAYAYSIWALFAGAHVYFMEAAAIITLISVGHWLEARMSKRAATSMKKLLSLAPAEALRRTSSGAEETVLVSALQRGDVVIVRPGERVPADSEVIEGTSSVDEAMLTGESMPVDKRPGAVAYGGTINLNARLVLRVQATGEATALAQIIAAVERAQHSRAGIQRLGDRISSVFVPIVVAVAAVTALWWGLAPDSARGVHAALQQFLWPVSLPETALALAAVHAAAVLIIACPCAMGLATPIAIMAGTNAGAERGILIRDGIALEKAGTISTVVFDKTGTLTYGKPRVTDQWTASSTDSTVMVGLAAELGRHSNHPLSQAIATVASTRVSITGSSELPGAGVQGEWNGQPVRLGSMAWLERSGAQHPGAAAPLAEWAGQGATVTGLALGNRIVAAFAMQDTLKEGAADVVAGLKKAGMRVCLLTGDNRVTANAIGKLLGISEADIAAEVRPEGKAAFVGELQARGERVAFVGDGINDAPALEQADLGIAVGRATDVAKMAADIVLLKADVHAIPESLGIARATLRAIKQNLFWAFFYNAAGIPLAALGFLSPVLCAAIMGLSDLVVIGNALRLRRWRG